MSEDLTKKLPISDRDTILTAIKRVEERLYDTRPIWHKVVADVAQLQTGQDGLRSEVHELSNKVDNIGRDQIVFNDAIRKINLEFHTIDERLHRLEMNRN